MTYKDSGRKETVNETSNSSISSSEAAVMIDVVIELLGLFQFWRAYVKYEVTYVTNPMAHSMANWINFFHVGQFQGLRGSSSQVFEWFMISNGVPIFVMSSLSATISGSVLDTMFVDILFDAVLKKYKIFLSR